MRIKHPEKYQSYEDINKLSLSSKISWIIIIIVLLIGLFSGIAYFQIQHIQNVNQAKIAEIQHLGNSVAKLDTEIDTLDYLKNSADPVARYIIGTPITLKESLPSYDKALSGYNYPIVDYFKIRNSDYYIRIICTSTTKEKFQTMLLNKKQYQQYQQYDQLQANFAKSIKQQNTYDNQKLAQLVSFKKQYPYFHN